MQSAEPTLFQRAAPRSAEAHLLREAGGSQLFLPAGSLLFDIDEALANELEAALSRRDGSATTLLEGQGLEPRRAVCEDRVEALPVRAVSLAVAQSCNLGCGYCYARGGSFGSAPRTMDFATARKAIDLLLAESVADGRANLAFLGGEPLVAREVVHQASLYADEKAKAAGVRLSFSITSNGSLITQQDIDLFESLGFAVTISLDGVGSTHDALRPFQGGRGSYEHILRRITPLLARQKRAQVSARITVTPGNLDLLQTLDTFIGLGFHTVGFSPMLTSPNGRHEMGRDDLARMLEAMVSCGESFEKRTLAGERYPFANLLNALREIHKGTHRPYPCGAGAGYLGVSADGDLSACHRFVGNEAGDLGSLDQGIDRAQQSEWLAARHVSAQPGCQTCWARYLCAGGCHHETLHRGRPACDFIRGWLHYAISAYGRLSRSRPDFVAGLAR